MKTQKAPSFRKLEKESVGVDLPIPIASDLRESAAKSRLSLNYIVTEALCLRLGHEPSRYGIEPSRKPKAAGRSAVSA